MSGHSKWATIKRKKAALDAKRGKAFTKLTKEITVAARSGGGDPAGNPRLRLLVDKAKEINMPNENVQRAIKRGTGEMPGMSYEEQVYEGYGPNGIAVIIDALTDNKNRTVAELRRIFTSKGGNLAESGAVSWMFQRMGIITAKTTLSEEQLLELLIEEPIHDITIDEGIATITCDPKSLEKVRAFLQQNAIAVEEAVLGWIPSNSIALSGEAENATYEFLSEIQDHDDIQNVYSNISDKG